MDEQITPETMQHHKNSHLKLLIVGVAIFVVACTLAFGVHAAADWYLAKTKISDGTVTCTTSGTTHFVFIEDGKAEPATTHGVLCDSLTIVNKDARLRLMAFGEHDKHQPYDGITEQALSEGQSLSVTFNKIGSYTFHDHIDDSSVGTFIVSR